MDEADIERLSEWLRRTLRARTLRIDDIQGLTGGAIQENLALEVNIDGGPRHGEHRWVLRRDAAASIAESHSRLNEHALLVAAFESGVCVPEPIVACSDADVLGTPFSLMTFRAGIGYGPKLVREQRAGGDRERLVERLGHELARIHAMDADRVDLAFLGGPPTDPARRELQRVRDGLDALGVARPGLERALRIAAATPPVAAGITFVHRDFRTGNLLVDEHGLCAILDWEFAGLGDPMSDIGWFCARCWRFSRPDLEAGGLGTRATLYRAYEQASGRTVDDAAVRWWERFAHLRWAMIALQQGARHDSGEEPSLALALTGRIADTLERDALRTALQGMAPGTRREPSAGAGAGAGAGASASASASARVGAGDSRGTDVTVPATTRPELPAAHLLPSAADALGTLMRTLPRAQAMTLRLAVRAIRVAARDVAGAGAVEQARQALLETAGIEDQATLARRIRAGEHDDSPDLDAALQRACDLIAASQDA